VIDLRRIFLSHGIAELPPMRLDPKAWTFEITVPLAGIGARTLVISQARPGQGLISVPSKSPTPKVAAAVMAQVRHVLSLDLDLTPFYAVAANGPDGAQPDRVRRRRQDNLHHEHVVGRDHPDGQRAGRAPRGEGAGRARRQPLWARLSHTRGNGRGAGWLL
jgi:hypothetical protein